MLTRGRRLGIGGVRRGVRTPPAVTTDYVVALRDAPSTITPVSLLIADRDYLTLVSGKASGWACAWGSGHNASQSTAARRGTWTKATGTVDFSLAGTNWMLMDYSTPVASGNFTFVIGLDIQSTAGGHQTLANYQTGTVSLLPDRSDKYAFNDGALRDTGEATTTGAQLLLFNLVTGGTASVRKNSADIGTGMTYTQRALGGTVGLASIYTGGSNHLDANITFYAVYAGAGVAADITAIEAVGTELLGL